MTMIERIMSALENRQYKELSECFAADGIYVDYCPALEGGECYYVYGREAIEMFFRNRFVHEHFEAASVRIEGAERATFFGYYDAPFVFASAEVESTDESGLVTRFTVRPV